MHQAAIARASSEVAPQPSAEGHEAMNTDDENAQLAYDRALDERKRSEAALRRLATVLQDSNDAITMQDLDGRIIAWNRGAVQMYGYSEREALQMNMEDLIPTDELERAREFRKAVRRGERLLSLEVKRKTKDGRLLDVWLTTTKLVDDGGRPVAIATTERDITQRKKTERENERLLDELTRALRARDEFLSVASHELQTPLAALKLKLEQIFLQVRRKADPEGDGVAAGIEVALRQTGRISRLVDDLLDVSRIASGRLRLEREEVNLSALVTDSVTRLREFAERGGCSLALYVQPDVVGHWDRLRVEQVLANLVTNAVKYGGRSSIDVSVEANASEATIVVRDRGPGIRESDQQRIFEQFVRAAPRGTGGLGLGLYITRQIVEAHGGQIRVESRAREGAAFIVTLPLRRQDSST